MFGKKKYFRANAKTITKTTKKITKSTKKKTNGNQPVVKQQNSAMPNIIDTQANVYA